MTSNQDKHQTNSENDNTLTNRQGHPITNNQGACAHRYFETRYARPY